MTLRRPGLHAACGQVSIRGKGCVRTERASLRKGVDVPQYVILADHAADICPSSNAKVRARAMEGMGQLLPKLAKEAGVVFQVGPLHLDPGHRTISVVEAPNIEAITQLVYDIGFSQWNTVEVCPVRPVSDLMANVDSFPIVFD